jgi:hypothetical protein
MVRRSERNQREQEQRHREHVVHSRDRRLLGQKTIYGLKEVALHTDVPVESDLRVCVPEEEEITG